MRIACMVFENGLVAYTNWVYLAGGKDLFKQMSRIFSKIKILFSGWSKLTVGYSCVSSFKP